jgi:hypothetical protein
MSRSIVRWAPLSGVAFVVLFVAAFLVGGSSPDSNDSNAKIAAYLAKDSNQTKNIVAFFILMVALLFLISFFASLRSRLVQAEGGVGRLGHLAFGAGIAHAVMLVTAVCIFISPIITADDADKFKVDPGLYRLTQDMGYSIWVLAVVVAALVTWAMAGAVFRTGFLPRWFGWVSVVTGIICLLGVFFVPIFVFWLWIVIASVLLYLRTEPEPVPAAATV